MNPQFEPDEIYFLREHPWEVVNRTEEGEGVRSFFMYEKNARSRARELRLAGFGSVVRRHRFFDQGEQSKHLDIDRHCPSRRPHAEHWWTWGAYQAYCIGRDEDGR